MKKMIWMVLLAGILMLAACGAEGDSAEDGMTAEIINTEFNSPETAEPGETLTLSVTVTQGDQLVEDADEVVYEIWESGKREESEMVAAEHAGEGRYEADKSFETEGLYFVQAHTTARSLHVMPKQEITIGDPDPATIVPDDSDDTEGMDKMDGHGDGH